MGKTSYKNTSELLEQLSKNLDKLNAGELDLLELNELVESGKELYEHLVILRYKAIDVYGEIEEQESNQNDSIDEIVTETEKEEVFDFSGSGFDENQDKTEEQPSFDFTLDSQEEISSPSEPEIKIEKEPSTPDLSDEINQDDFTDEDEDQNSLNELLKNEEEVSLRKKLQNSPIEDIKSHISIAKKFEYISNMFGGDSEAYNSAIDKLNSCEDGGIARQKLNEYTTNYQWDLEDKSIIKFIELVERRYI